MSELTPFQVFDQNYQMAQNELEKVFSYHPPASSDTVETYAALRAHARRFAAHIMAVQPDSEERRAAVKAVREAVMWANAGIACNGMAIASPEDPDDIDWRSDEHL